VGISAVSGFITGAFGAKFPGAHRLVEGVVDTVVSAGERYLYAVFDDSMSREEKRAYALDPRQMVADFVTGVVIGEFLDGITAAIQNKLRSIFANYDATMREALESGSGTGTVWDNITPTQENYPYTNIPKSFEIEVNGEKMWVHGNATEHMYEDVYKGITTGNGTAYTNPNLYTQEIMSDFCGSLQEATKSGIVYG
ncbi:hypothetical protein, partial [Catenibacterium faecis]|uniref:hypothetical protein n=1 Tax=Catenibacterium faecis TaxID=2764323 RepID=UPI003F804A1E